MQLRGRSCENLTGAKLSNELHEYVRRNVDQPSLPLVGRFPQLRKRQRVSLQLCVWNPAEAVAASCVAACA